MFKRLTATSLAILLSAVLSFAHEKATHVMGTVTGLDANAVTVKTQDGQSVSVNLEEATEYVKDGLAMTKADLKVGLRVMIEAQVDEDTNVYRAEEVMLGVMDPTAADGHTEHEH